MSQGFRIIGVKVLEGCSSNIQKNLKAGVLYRFCSDYKASDKDDYTLENSISGVDLDAIYDVKSTERHKISVHLNAIVGKNGDGKSSLVEIMLRIINNFAYHYGFLADHESIMKVNGLRAILYYEVDGRVYAMASESDDSLDVYRDGVRIEMNRSNDNPAEKKKRLRELIGTDLFYTLIVNYSLYAYNSKILKDENEGDGCWIQSLFHKNDAYQTPIVLNPMRTEGNINVNKEESLAKQRLLSLYVLNGADATMRSIGEGCTAEGFAYRLEHESKLDTISIRQFFRENRFKHLPWIAMERAFDREQPDRGVKKELATEVCLKFLQFWQSFIPWFERQPNLKKRIEEERHYMEHNYNVQSDLAEYMLRIHSWIGELKLDCDQGYAKSIDWFARVSKLNWLSYTQFYRILVIKTVWETLAERTDGAFDYSLDEAFGAKDNPRASAMKYATYKVISILETYQKFGNQTYIWDTTYEPFGNPLDDNVILNLLKKEVLKVLEVDDYTTLKLHQTLHYLKANKRAGCKLISLLHGQRTSSEGIVMTGAQNVSGIKYNRYITFEQEHKNIVGDDANPRLSDIVKQLPPPIFEGEIMVRGQNLFPISQLSSGQIQMLYSVSTFIYHLRNLNYAQEGEMIEYRHINAVFEEVELYFHPEYQKQFVKFLLDQIRHAGLNHIKSISICLVTHSPFVLSDVLGKNILYLKNGKDASKEINVNPFGANINNVLCQSFFLENGFLGTFSSDRILSLGKWLKGKSDADEWNMDLAKAVVASIQEPYIRKQLDTLLEKYCAEHLSAKDKIADLGRQIDLLNKRIQELQSNEKDTDR